MDRESKKLRDFKTWFEKFIKRNYGKKCSDFIWGCPVCRAYSVKELFSDFVRDSIETENWFKKRKKK